MLDITPENQHREKQILDSTKVGNEQLDNATKRKKYSHHRECKNTSVISEYAFKNINFIFKNVTFSSNLETQ